MSNADHPAYIGRSPCGCITFATVDMPEHKRTVAKEVAQAMRDGLTIERVTVQFVRENWGPGCDQCRPKPKGKTKKAQPATVVQEALQL